MVWYEVGMVPRVQHIYNIHNNIGIGRYVDTIPTSLPIIFYIHTSFSFFSSRGFSSLQLFLSLSSFDLALALMLVFFFIESSNQGPREARPAKQQRFSSILSNVLHI